MVVCTICASNYLVKALCLVDSLKSTHPKAQIVICLLERSCDYAFTTDGRVTIIIASELKMRDFPRLMFRHSIMEASTAIKAHLMLWLMERYKDENEFVYLDPDVYLYSPLVEVPALLEKHAILLTPHHLHDEATTEGTRDNILRSLQCGIFNLGFIATARSDRTTEFLNWWASKLQDFCYAEPSRGLFVDQKWLDIAIGLFEIGIVRHPGYNVANWNVSQRHVHRDPETAALLVNKEQLRFFHFSKIDSEKDLFYFSKYLRPGNCVLELREEYLGNICKREVRESGTRSWSYDTYYSGEAISDFARSLYRADQCLQLSLADPFSASNHSIINMAAQRSRG